MTGHLSVERLARLTAIRDRLDGLEASLRGQRATVRAARRLNVAAATLATSVLLDSGLEHYRGSFENPAMVTPLVVSALTLAVSAHGTADHRPAAHGMREFSCGAAALTGLAGTAFHVYNVLKRPGRVAWQNLFYGAPLGAPAAMLLAGALGWSAEQVREAEMRRRRARLLIWPAGRALAGLAGLGLLGTTGEAGLLHFRGAFHNPFMLTPVTLPPIGAALLLHAAARGGPRDFWLARLWMRLLAFMGIAGVGFHAAGVGRNMGGWRNWSQNVLNGPPLPAPPSFTGLALAALAALDLLRERGDA